MQEERDVPGPGTVTEVVGRFAARAAFTAAVEDLLGVGFVPSDLSVLDTHEALSVAGSSGEVWQTALSGLVGEIKYVGPITAAGLIAIATGPVGAAVSAAVAAGLTGAALAELLGTLRATPHTESFARARLNRGRSCSGSGSRTRIGRPRPPTSWRATVRPTCTATNGRPGGDAAITSGSRGLAPLKGPL